MSYKGKQVSLPVGLGGFNYDDNITNVPPSSLVQARNMTFDGKTWRKMPGLAQYDTGGITGNPNILEAIQYVPDSTTKRIISACSNGSVYREDAGNIDASTVATGLTFTDAVQLIEAGQESFGDDKKLFLFSKGVPPRVLLADGTTMAALTDIPVDWSGANQPDGGTYHDSRMVAFMSHYLYFSNLNDQADFITGNPAILSIAPGRADKISACFSYLPQQLYVFKFPVGIYRIDTTDITADLIPIDTVKTDIGCAGPRALCRVKNDVWFISASGHIHSLTAVNSSEDTSESDITALLRLTPWVRDNIDLTKISHANMVYHEERQEVRASFTSKTGTANDICLILDVSDPNAIKCSVDDRGSYFESLFHYRESDGSYQIYVAGKLGKLFKTNRTARSIDGSTGYTSVFEYAETDLGFADPEAATKLKRFDWLEITAIPSGNYDMTFEIFLDGVRVKVVTVNLGQVGGTLDSFILDTDRLGGSTAINPKVRISGRGRRIAVRGTNSGTNQDFGISEVRLFYKDAQTKGTK